MEKSLRGELTKTWGQLCVAREEERQSPGCAFVVLTEWPAPGKLFSEWTMEEVHGMWVGMEGALSFGAADQMRHELESQRTAGGGGIQTRQEQFSH